ncbi:MAG: hypothetical protein ACI9WU_005368 [Myxococcota bacterium]|jgi:hypothetical protein
MPPEGQGTVGRAAASRAHLAALLLTPGLYWTLKARRSSDAFVSHHGHQASLAIAAIHLLLGVHIVLYGAALGVSRLARWVRVEAGGGAEVALTEWALTALGFAQSVNAWALVGELVVAAVLIGHQARCAAAGRTTRYFFWSAL